MEEIKEGKRYTAIEIGSRSVRLVHGYLLDGKVYVLHAVSATTNSISNGFIKDPENLTATIAELVRKVDIELNITIKDVVLALPPFGLVPLRNQTQSITVDDEGKIGELDIANCVYQLQKAVVPNEYKVVDVIPFNYILDNKDSSVEKPIGKISRSLTVNAAIYTLKETVIESYTSVVSKAGLKIIKATISTLANVLYLEGIEPINEITTPYTIIDIGSDFTTFSLINNGIIYRSAVIQDGSMKINDIICNKFNINAREANILKEKYGISASPSFKINVSNQLNFEDIANACKESLETLVEKIKEFIKAQKDIDLTRYPFVLLGGGSKLKGMVEYFNNELPNLKFIEVTPYSFGARDKSYLTCLGLIKYGGLYLDKVEKEDLVNVEVSRVNENDKNNYSSNYKIDEEL